VVKRFNPIGKPYSTNPAQQGHKKLKKTKKQSNYYCMTQVHPFYGNTTNIETAKAASESPKAIAIWMSAHR
jgi:hypothetical protein